MASIPCVCPPKADGTPRHPNGDTVRLRETLDFRAGRAARLSVVILKEEDAEASTADILAAMTTEYMLGGIESWTLQDAKGKPIEVTRPAIRAFMRDHPEEADLVGDEADALYTARVLRPLVERAQTLSQRMPTSEPTSAKTGSGQNRKRSTPSSIITIQTAGTEKMSASHGGGYS